MRDGVHAWNYSNLLHVTRPQRLYLDTRGWQSVATNGGAVRKQAIGAVLVIALASGLAACSSPSNSGTTVTTFSTANSPSTTAPAPSTTAPAPITATSAAAKMISSGVPATIAFTYTAENDPNKKIGRMGGYTSKVSMQDSRLPKVGDFLGEASSIDGGAAIECYPDSSGANARYQELMGYSGTFLGDGYDYVSGTCFLRLTKDLTPTQASQYQSAFETRPVGI